jgi:hypothetical protein
VSPIVKAMQNLYTQPAPAGMIYVMYAPPGQGTTFGARALLEHFNAFPVEGQQVDEHVKGFMITGHAVFDDDYMSELCDCLGATEVKGWMHALLLAMDGPAARQPSLLILDGFNSLGTNEVNLSFIQRLHGLITKDMDLFVVVLMTQNKNVATRLCSLNHGGHSRIAPLPLCYSGEPTLPVWSELTWDRSLLVDAFVTICLEDTLKVKILITLL